MTHEEIQELKVGDCIITVKGSYRIIAGWRAKGVKKPYVGCQRGAWAGRPDELYSDEFMQDCIGVDFCVGCIISERSRKDEVHKD